MNDTASPPRQATATSSHADLIARMNKKDRQLALLMEAIGPIIAQNIKEHTERVAAPLRARITALENAPRARWCGVWERGRTYHEQELTTDNGSMWVCLRQTQARPGNDPACWRLAVKRGNAPNG